jgi:hypothetical protein
MVSEKQLKSDFQYLTFLDESGYLPLTSKAEVLLCESTLFPDLGNRTTLHCYKICGHLMAYQKMNY